MPYRSHRSSGRIHVPVLPPSLRSTRTASSTAAGSTALTMSCSVSPATATAVSASISTPVRSVVRTVARIATSASPRLELDHDAAERDRVAQRHEVGGALGAHDPGDPRGGQRVALGQPVAAQQVDHLGRGAQGAGGHRGAGGRLLAGDVHHPGRPGGVDMGQVHIQNPTTCATGRRGRVTRTWVKPSGCYDLRHISRISMNLT